MRGEKDRPCLRAYTSSKLFEGDGVRDGCLGVDRFTLLLVGIPLEWVKDLHQEDSVEVHYYSFWVITPIIAIVNCAKNLSPCLRGFGFQVNCFSFSMLVFQAWSATSLDMGT